MKLTDRKIFKDILEYVEHKRPTDRCIHNALREPMKKESSDSYKSILDNTLERLVNEKYVDEERKAYYLLYDEAHYVPFYTIADRGLEYLNKKTVEKQLKC